VQRIIIKRRELGQIVLNGFGIKYIDYFIKFNKELREVEG